MIDLLTHVILVTVQGGSDKPIVAMYTSAGQARDLKHSTIWPGQQRDPCFRHCVRAATGNSPRVAAWPARLDRPGALRRTSARHPTVHRASDANLFAPRSSTYTLASCIVERRQRLLCPDRKEGASHMTSFIGVRSITGLGSARPLEMLHIRTGSGGKRAT